MYQTSSRLSPEAWWSSLPSFCLDCVGDKSWNTLNGRHMLCPFKNIQTNHIPVSSVIYNISSKTSYRFISQSTNSHSLFVGLRKALWLFLSQRSQPMSSSSRAIIITVLENQFYQVYTCYFIFPTSLVSSVWGIHLDRLCLIMMVYYSFWPPKTIKAILRGDDGFLGRLCREKDILLLWSEIGFSLIYVLFVVRNCCVLLRKNPKTLHFMCLL